MAEVDVFSALAHPVRRRLLEALQDGPRAAGELAGPFALSRPAVSEHLAVLRNARLVREEPRGRHRYYHLNAAPLAEVDAWLHPFERYWRTRLTALRDLLDEDRSQSQDPRQEPDGRQDPRTDQQSERGAPE